MILTLLNVRSVAYGAHNKRFHYLKLYTNQRQRFTKATDDTHKEPEEGKKERRRIKIMNKKNTQLQNVRQLNEW